MGLLHIHKIRTYVFEDIVHSSLLEHFEMVLYWTDEYKCKYITSLGKK